MNITIESDCDKPRLSLDSEKKQLSIYLSAAPDQQWIRLFVQVSAEVKFQPPCVALQENRLLITAHSLREEELLDILRIVRGTIIPMTNSRATAEEYRDAELTQRLLVYLDS